MQNDAEQPGAIHSARVISSPIPACLYAIGWLCLAAGAVMLAAINSGPRASAPVMWQVGAASVIAWAFWLALGLALRLLIDIRNAAVTRGY